MDDVIGIFLAIILVMLAIYGGAWLCYFMVNILPWPSF